MDSLDRIPIGVIRPGLSGPAGKSGFTLVELVIVVCAAAILAAIAIEFYGNSIYRAQVQIAIRDVGVLQARIEKYSSDNNALPSSLGDLNLPLTETTDPWGFQYQYINHLLAGPGSGHIRRDRSLNPLNPDYDLYSIGKDGDSKMPITAAESQDDVIRALGGAYIGLASGF